MKSAIIKYYPFLPLFLLCCFYGYKAIDFPIHDFANYYFGGQFLAEGRFNSGIYFPYVFNKMIAGSGHDNIFVSYAPNTPFLAFCFLPFCLFTVTAAKFIFNWISIGLFVLSIWRLFSFYKINPKWALLIPILFLVPIKNNLLFGQVYLLLFFLLSEGWLAYERERWKSMALFWGLAILLKVFPALLILFLVFRKQWKALCYLALSCLLLLAISLFFTGIDIWLFYGKEVLPKASNGEIANSFVDNYQSVFMFLKRLLVYQDIENPDPFFNSGSWFAATVFAFKIGVLAIGYFVSQRNANTIFAFAYWILATILISPYGSTYTFILLLFSFFALLKTDSSTAKKRVVFSLLLLLNNLPLSLFMENPFPLSYLRMFALLLFFGLLVSLVYHDVRWKVLTAVTVLPMIVVLFFKPVKTEKSTILLKDAPILIYDYQVQTHSEINYYFLTARFWDGKEKTIFWEAKIKAFQPLTLKNNQVFYQNRQMTFDQSHKLKPMLIDHKTILFLSDYDRGIGFYTLRKIELR